MNGVAEALWIRINDAVERKQTYVHIRIDEIQMAIDELERLERKSRKFKASGKNLLAEIKRLNLKIELMEAYP